LVCSGQSKDKNLSKFQNHTTIPCGRISNEPEERKRERKRRKKMPFIVANYISAYSQGAHTLLRPKVWTIEGT
jgi:hypothetical protein